MPVHLIETQSLSGCWLAVSRLILDEGQDAYYSGDPIREIANLSLAILAPDPDDSIILKYGDSAWLGWMHANFFIQKAVAELGNAPSYAVRLFNYAGQRDQLQWVTDRLSSNPEARDAAITTFMPLTDTSYIPCISLLDFWIPQHALELVVYAHSLDFGKKAYGNLVELAKIQKIVADRLGRQAGMLVLHVKTAHIYQLEFDYMSRLVKEQLQ
jgi:thymidylate synthase